MDCNIFHPYADHLLTVAPEYGLTDYLSSQELGIQDIIHASGIPRLRLIPAGPSSDAAVEYFNSDRMRQFVADLKARYHDRFIVLDVPPVRGFAEARMLSSLCDYAVLVVPYGEVTPDEVMSGIDAVGQKRFAGVIFNE